MSRRERYRSRHRRAAVLEVVAAILQGAAAGIGLAMLILFAVVAALLLTIALLGLFVLWAAP